MIDLKNPTLMLDAFEDVLATSLALARDLPAESADVATDCPGWTVRDQLAHIVSLEQSLIGSPAVLFELPPLHHVQSDFQRFTEAGVYARRLLPLAAIADELAGLLPRRMAQLRDLLQAGGDPQIPGPFGVRPMSAVLSLRTFDMWAHEQDIRRAVGQAPRVACDAARVALARTLTAWERSLADIAGIDGVLTFDVTAPDAEQRSVTVGTGGEPATIRGDAAALTWLGCGRGRLESAGAAIATSGSGELLAAISPHLAFTP